MGRLWIPHVVLYIQVGRYVLKHYHAAASVARRGAAAAPLASRPLLLSIFSSSETQIYYYIVHSLIVKNCALLAWPATSWDGYAWRENWIFAVLAAYLL